MQLLDSKPKNKKKNWVTGALGGTLLAALVLPLALTGASAALDGGSFLIQAENTSDPEITSRSGMLLSDSDGGEVDPGGDDLASNVSMFTFQCEVDTTGHFGTLDEYTTSFIAADAVVRIEGDSTPKKVVTQEEELTLKAKKVYKVEIEGKLTSPQISSESIKNCMTEFNFVGEDVGISDMSTRSERLVKVPKVLPRSVGDLSYAFAQNFILNDPNISGWDTSSVWRYGWTFQNAKKFNQPLNDWDVSTNTHFNSFFSGAESFNQPLNNWKTSNAEVFDSMFVGATAFNQDLSMWATKNATLGYNGMFTGASSFDQDLSSWYESGRPEESASMFDGTAMEGKLDKQPSKQMD